MFLTRVHDRFLPTGLAALTDPTNTGPLRATADRYSQAIDVLAHHNGLTA